MLACPRPVLALVSVALPWYAVLPAAGQSATEDFKLTALDAAAGDSFGSSVAVSGTTAIVGAIFDENATGAAYTFSTTTGRQRFKLTASDGAEEDRFGESVAVSGGSAIVGAPGFQFGLGNTPGAAYIYDTASGQQLFKLTVPGAAAGDRFGTSVGISGGVAVVGVPYDDDAEPDSGSAYVFEVATARRLFKLTAFDGDENDTFGWSVAISGTTAIVGARWDDDDGFNSGSAYLFDTTTGQQLRKLTASDAAEDDRFGWSVAISGSIAVIGAPGDDNSRGSAYVFDTTTGRQLFKLTASDAVIVDRFGWSVAISGTTAIVGAPFNSDAGSASGSAYVFDTATGTEFFKLTASDAAQSDQFGANVAIAGTAVVVGAIGNDDAGSSSGSAYVYRVTTCPADWNADGSANVLDVVAFINAWNAGDPSTDLNADGSINILDVVAFINRWNQGCA